jgi:hypothetical protein
VSSSAATAPGIRSSFSALRLRAAEPRSLAAGRWHSCSSALNGLVSPRQASTRRAHRHVDRVPLSPQQRSCTPVLSESLDQRRDPRLTIPRPRRLTLPRFAGTARLKPYPFVTSNRHERPFGNCVPVHNGDSILVHQPPSGTRPVAVMVCRLRLKATKDVAMSIKGRSARAWLRSHSRAESPALSNAMGESAAPVRARRPLDAAVWQEDLRRSAGIRRRCGGDLGGTRAGPDRSGLEWVLQPSRAQPESGRSWAMRAEGQFSRAHRERRAAAASSSA